MMLEMTSTNTGSGDKVIRCVIKVDAMHSFKCTGGRSFGRMWT